MFIKKELTGEKNSVYTKEKRKRFVYKELEILASVNTKSMGEMKALPLVEQAPFMH